MLDFNTTRRLSPLSLLVLAACGGSKNKAEADANASTGVAVKGPLQNALAFVDANDNRAFDSGEASVRTAADGSYSLSNPDGHNIVVVTDENTIDTASGQALPGIRLVASSESQVVSPFTTALAANPGLDKAELATALGLDGVDLETFNPYADGVDAAQALRAEKIAQQIITVANVAAQAKVGEDSTISSADAFDQAFADLVAGIASKVANDESIDLTDESFIESVVGENANVVEAIAQLNEKIENVTDLDSDAAKETFAESAEIADDFGDGDQTSRPAIELDTNVIITVDEGLEAALEGLNDDFIEVGDKIEGFANALSAALDPFTEAGEPLETTVSDTGISVTYAGGLVIEAQFANFTPTTLAGLEAAIDNFDPADPDTWTIDGGFERLTFSQGNERSIVVKNEQGEGDAEDSIRIELKNAELGEVDAAVIRGDFGNQISDLFPVLASLQSLSDYDAQFDALNVQYYEPNADYEALNAQWDALVAEQSEGVNNFIVDDINGLVSFTNLSFSLAKANEDESNDGDLISLRHDGEGRLSLVVGEDYRIDIDGEVPQLAEAVQLLTAAGSDNDLLTSAFDDGNLDFEGMQFTDQNAEETVFFSIDVEDFGNLLQAIEDDAINGDGATTIVNGSDTIVQDANGHVSVVFEGFNYTEEQALEEIGFALEDTEFA